MTLAKVPHDLKIETITILKTALKAIAIRGIPYLALIFPKILGKWLLLDMAAKARPVEATKETPVPNGEIKASR